MGWFSSLITAIPIYLFWSSDHRILATLAAVNTIVNFWSYGVMHNYSVSASSQKFKQLQVNLRDQGDLTPERQAHLDKIPLEFDPNAVPDWLAKINLATTVLGVVGIVSGIIIS
jgi:hypothetical protein